jgi:hypothetical protein
MNKNFFALISLILAGLIYPFFITPLWDEVSVRLNDKKQIQSAQTSVDNFIQRRNELVKVVETISQEDINRLSRLLPESVNTLTTIVDIENLARNNGFILKGEVAVDDEKAVALPTNPDGSIPPSAPYQTTTFKVNLVGPYSALKPFLEELATSLTLFDISGLSFNTSDTGVYDFVISIRTYSLTK